MVCRRDLVNEHVNLVLSARQTADCLSSFNKGQQHSIHSRQMYVIRVRCIARVTGVANESMAYQQNQVQVQNDLRLDLAVYVSGA